MVLGMAMRDGHGAADGAGDGDGDGAPTGRGDGAQAGGGDVGAIMCVHTHQSGTHLVRCNPD